MDERFADEFLSWLERETDFCEWDESVKASVRSHLLYLLEMYFPSPGMEE